MVSSVINATMSSADPVRHQQFYQAYQPFKDTAPVELRAGDSTADVEVAIRAVYRQVFGNAHVMESERSTVPESQFKRGELSVREFVRQLAKSELYSSRFFDNCYRYRSIELNFKHLLGRAPDNFDEMRYHSNILDRSGFEADIDTYIDSDEYQNAFGENIVPYYRGYQTQPGQSMLEFTNMFQLLRSASSSDKDLETNNQPQLTRALIQNSPYGQLKASNVSDILANVFKPKYPANTPVYFQMGAAPTPSPALQQEIREQSQTIATLQKQLADLSPFAAIGSAYLTDWQSTDVGASQRDAQSNQIAKLQSQIADARRYAAIGESRLNKWRSRTFNG
jgi:phycoerythrin-associated linker protein